MYKYDWIETPIGKMIAVADEEALVSLQFSEQVEIPAIPGITPPIQSIREELSRYFKERLVEFQTPIKMGGSPFQQQVWEALCKIPFGSTCSYGEIAATIGNPLAVRAVGTANGANRFPIMIPCHRVIRSNGDLGGYSSGLDKKRWLLSYERGWERVLR